MTHCAKCGAELIGTRKFCTACGAPAGDPRSPAASTGMSPAAPGSAPATSRAAPPSSASPSIQYAPPPPVSRVDPFARTAGPATAEQAAKGLTGTPRYGPPPSIPLELATTTPGVGDPSRSPQVSPLATSNVDSGRGAFVEAMAISSRASSAPKSVPPQSLLGLSPDSSPSGIKRGAAAGTQMMPSIPNPAMLPRPTPAAAGVSSVAQPSRPARTQVLGVFPGLPSQPGSPQTSSGHPGAPSPPPAQPAYSAGAAHAAGAPLSAGAHAERLSAGAHAERLSGAAHSASSAPGSQRGTPPTAPIAPTGRRDSSVAGSPPPPLGGTEGGPKALGAEGASKGAGSQGPPPQAPQAAALHHAPPPMHAGPGVPMPVAPGWQAPHAPPPPAAPYAPPPPAAPYAPPQPLYPHPMQAPPHAPAAAAGYGYGFSYVPGSRVTVTWSNGQRYPGTITQVTGNQCMVVFPDGQHHWVEMQYLAPG